MADFSSIPDFYKPYFTYIKEESLHELLRTSQDKFNNLLGDLSEAQALHRYQPEKWSIKDLIQHLIDAERVFAYRALRFSRNDKTDLAGFEENEYAIQTNADGRAYAGLIEEFNSVRVATIHLFSSFDDEQLKRVGTANAYEFSVEIVGYLISGHLLHHLNVISERYL